MVGRRNRCATHITDEGQEALIYHLALADDWTSAQADIEGYRVSTIGRSLDDVGFIHCSHARQVRGVADAYYRGRSDVVLLTIDPGRVRAPIREEMPPGVADAFPHIYGPLNLDAVVAVEPLAARADGTLAFDL